MLAMRVTELASRSEGKAGSGSASNSAAETDRPLADHTVAIRSILERVAHLDESSTGPITWPPAEVAEPWAGISAPRTGWRLTHEVALSVLAARAEVTLAPLADVQTTDPSGTMNQVLGQVDPVLTDLLGVPFPAGLSAAAQSLGFLVGADEATAKVSTNGMWLRVSTDQVHVLVKQRG